MTNSEITNPTVRRLLADEIASQRRILQRQSDPKVRDYWREHYKERYLSFTLFAIAVQGALERGELKSTRGAAIELGKIGGQSTSEAKRAAVRENGKKGGRPKKAPTPR
jgi:hypothetical protein